MSFGIPVKNGLGIGLSAYATLSSRKPLWTPAQLPTALWMDANDANTITLNGTTVSQWSDKSGNTRNFTQAVATRQPAYVTNGLGTNNVLQFDGSDDFLTIGSTGLLRNVSGSSAFVVGQWISVPTAARSIMSILSGAGNARLQIGSIINFPKFEVGGRRLDSNSFQLAASSAQDITTTNAFIQASTISYVDTLGQQWIDGTLDGQNAAFQTSGNTSNTSSNGTVIGAGTTGGGQAANINIGEIIVLHQAVSADTRQKFEGYLAWKWGLQGSLPVGHPYKNAPPTV